MDQEQPSRWRPTRRQILWTLAIVAVLTVAILIGYRYGITLWDWIKLLVVPAVIAGGGLWFNRQQRERELEIASEQREQEVAIAERRTKDEALQAYLAQMGQMLTDKEQPLHTAKPGDNLSAVARARTLSILPRLSGPSGGSHKEYIVLFLYEARLITTEHGSIVNLSGADLTRLHMSIVGKTGIKAGLKGEGVSLRGIDLSRCILAKADLTGVDLSAANLSESLLWDALLVNCLLVGANLSGANMWDAFGSGADLSKANLSNADLSGADLSGADLSNATLQETNLSNAKLQETNLSEARLWQADLRQATGWNDEQLNHAESLEDATMPNGQKYEDWLRDKKAQGKDEKNE